MQQNISAPGTDIKTFTDSKSCGVTKNAKSTQKECPNIHESRPSKQRNCQINWAVLEREEEKTQISDIKSFADKNQSKLCLQVRNNILTYF